MQKLYYMLVLSHDPTLVRRKGAWRLWAVCLVCPALGAGALLGSDWSIRLCG